MRQPPARRRAILGLTPVLVATALSLSAPPAVGGAPASASLPPRSGFFVTGYGYVSPSQDGVQLQDGRGGEHVLVNTGAHFTYLTRSAGSSHWVRTTVPGSAERVQRNALLTLNGKRVIFFVNNSSRFTSASVTATKLPQPRRIATKAQCALPSALAVALPGGRIADLSENDHARPAICSGAPGEAMTTTVLPERSEIDPQSIARDRSTGRMTIVGEGEHGIFMWTATKAHHWTGPRKIAPLGADSDVTVTGEAAADGQVWVAMTDLLDHPSHWARPRLLHRTRSGKWTKIRPLPHTTGHDGLVQLVANDKTGAIHAVYIHALTDQGSFAGKITQQYFAHGVWSKPRLMSHHADLLVNVFLSPAGHPVAGYIQSVL
jgi:hypothetical protein